MKRGLILFLLCSSLLLTGCGKAETVAEEKAIAVTVQMAKGGEIENTNTFTGTTKVSEETSVTAEMAGKIQSINVELGDHVSEGQVLLSIDGKDVNNNIKTAQAALELAQANYANTTGGSIESQQNTLDNAVKVAQMSYDEAKRNYDIYKSLYDTGAISEDQFKKIELSLDQASQQLETAQKSYNTTTGQSIPEIKELAAKQLEQAKTAYEVATTAKDKLVLKSPVSGTITTKNFNEGEMISQQQPAFIISSQDVLQIDLKVTQADIGKFKQGDTVDVAIEGENVEGTIKYVPAVIDKNTSLYTVEVIIDNSGNKFREGLSVEVSVSIEKESNAITIPKKAVFEEDGEEYVYIVSPDNIAIKTSVETGIVTDKTIEIKSGVGTSDTVIIGGLNTITDGTKIFPVEKED